MSLKESLSIVYALYRKGVFDREDLRTLTKLPLVVDALVEKGVLVQEAIDREEAWVVPVLDTTYAVCMNPSQRGPLKRKLREDLKRIPLSTSEIDVIIQVIP